MTPASFTAAMTPCASQQLPVRCATVLEPLSVGPASVSELAAPFDMKLPSFVQHLSVLEESRLVKSKKRGRVRTYEIAPERFKVAEEWLLEQRRLWESRLDRFDEYVKRLKEKESRS